MRVAILGAGSLGSVFGGQLALTGNEVHLVGRKAHMDAIRGHGLTLVYPDGSDKQVDLSVHEDADDLGIMDLVVVLCKSYDTEAVLREALGAVGVETTVMSLQNGLGAEDVLVDLVGPEHVIAGKTYVGGMLLEPGKVQATVGGKATIIGEMDGSVTPRVMQIAQAFNEAGLETSVSDDVMRVVWGKLLINVATGAVCGITGLPYGDMYQDSKLVTLAIDAIEEAMAVAASMGIDLSDRTPEDVLKLARENLPASFKPSILQSLEKRRHTEIDAINGSVVRLGERQGVPTPVNRALVALIGGIERRIDTYDLA